MIKKSINQKINKSVYFLVFLIYCLLPQISLAECPCQAAPLPEVEIYSIDFDAGLITKGYTITSPEEDFRLGVFPDVLSAPTEFVLKKRKDVGHLIPENKIILSDYWEFDIVNKETYDGEKPIIVQMQYQESIVLKEVVFWNGSAWQKLPSKVIDPENNIIRAYFHLPYARFLVLGDMTKMSEGKASWYRYQGCNCAASPDFAKNTLLRVTNIDNGESVVIKVNDYGPDRDIHPERVIDLDIVAFRQIGDKSDGLIEVIVEPVEVY